MNNIKPDYTRLRAVLKKYGETTVTEMQQILKDKGALHLQDNITQDVIDDMEFVKLVISMPGYGVWADSGRGSGMFPPYQSIKDWCDEHGKPEKAVFPIMKKIANFGTKNSAKDFLKVFYLNLDNFKDEISEAITEDYVQVLRQVINYN